MRHLLLAFTAGLVATTACAQNQAQADPFIGLEDIDAPKALAWVEGQNARTADRLEKDPRYAAFHAQARAIFTAEDRIPWPSFRAGGVDNFWQDAEHTHGIWRHASLASFKTAAPAWDVTLDLDALSKAEGKNWIWKGADCRKPTETLCLVRLSNGGGDAVEVREYDTAKKVFVANGFRFAEGKQTLDWIDADHVLAAREWTPGEVTASGYAYVVKVVGRDGATREVFRGLPTDVSAAPVVLHGEGARADALLVRRGITFFESEYRLVGAAEPIALPKKSEFEAYISGQLVFALKEAWNGFGAGALVSYDLKALQAGTAKPVLIFQPGPRQAIQQVDATDSRLVVNLLDEVKGAVDAYAFTGGKWSAARRLALPKDATFGLRSTAGSDDQLFVSAEGFLDPTSLWLADAAGGQAAQLKALPAQFDASRHEVRQYWATSSDGTKIPYFVVWPKAAKLDGSTPTIMYGYGGFEIAKPPIYLPEMGKIWLERGGAYVIANIRGGGEFGPAWHQAAIKANKQRSYEDFIAVAEDLVAAKITSPRHLGIMGGSNGGLLMGATFTQRPDLFNAVVCQVPLLDMRRFHKLLAGASWMAEYGNPDDAKDWDVIRQYSPYHNVSKDKTYPKVFFTTSTRDDRVHPGHARKMVARMTELGHEVYYYENTEGGHGGAADNEQRATLQAIEFTYLWQRLAPRSP